VRFLRAIKTILGILAIFFVGLTMTLLIVFPRVINWLADLLGTGAENWQHWIPAIVIDLILLILAYVWVWRPWQQFRAAQNAQGLIVRKGQGRAYMDAESVRQQVYAAVMKVSDVQRADVTISNDLGRAVVQIGVTTENTIQGPKKKQEISRDVRKIVEDQLGIRMAGEPIINISLAPISGESLSVARPQPSFQAAAPEPRAPAAAVPAPMPAVPPRVEPLGRPKPSPVELAKTEAAPVLPLKSEVESKVDESDEGGTNAATPPKPFVRRPFAPPSGSARLPDLPPIPASKPASEDKAPAESDESPDEDMPSLGSLTGDEDEEKKDQASSDS
jgi:hypothetical protein